MISVLHVMSTMIPIAIGLDLDASFLLERNTALFLKVFAVLCAMSTMVQTARFLGLGTSFLRRVTCHILVTEVLVNEHDIRRWRVREHGGVLHSG